MEQEFDKVSIFEKILSLFTFPSLNSSIFYPVRNQSYVGQNVCKLGVSWTPLSVMLTFYVVCLNTYYMSGKSTAVRKFYPNEHVIT